MNKHNISERKVAFVTGAAQGIGKAIAARLIKDGFVVVCADVNQARLEEAVRDLGGTDAAYAVKVDVADRNDVFRAVQTTVDRFSDLHVVINNAGLAPMTPMEDFTYETYRRVFDVNVGGVMWGIQAATKAFKELGHGGKIINASSQAGQLGYAGLPVYCGTKFAVRGITQSAAKELAEFGITVNAYCPGIVKTPMMSKLAEDLKIPLNDWSSLITLKRLSEPEDVANAVAFLASQDSDYMTGQALVVDGGMIFN